MQTSFKTQITFPSVIKKWLRHPILRQIEGVIVILPFSVILYFQQGLASVRRFKCISEKQPQGHLKTKVSGWLPSATTSTSFSGICLGISSTKSNLNLCEKLGKNFPLTHFTILCINFILKIQAFLKRVYNHHDQPIWQRLRLL